VTPASPEQAIRDYLTAASLVTSTKPAGGGWQAETSTGGMDAVPETIDFGKVRSVPGRQVHWVTFETRGGKRMQFTCCVEQDDAGAWTLFGGAGGVADCDPVRGHPWVDLGGGGWPRHVYAGGRMLEDGGAVARVRLHAANGIVLEDTVEHGVVLFVSDDEVRVPTEAELLDANGRLIHRHPSLR
jgi:hypothetical protein